MCHRTRISIPPCQGEEILSALYAILSAKVNLRKPANQQVKPKQQGNRLPEQRRLNPPRELDLEESSLRAEKKND